jgi:hypothetical protein
VVPEGFKDSLKQVKMEKWEIDDVVIGPIGAQYLPSMRLAQLTLGC